MDTLLPARNCAHEMAMLANLAGPPGDLRHAINR